jgi:phage gp29-like protein
MKEKPELIDANGNPLFKKTANAAASLAMEQARASLTGVRQAWGHESVVAGMTPVRLASIMRRANTGDAHDYLVLAEEMEEREPHYASVLATRKLAVRGLRPVVEAASDDARDVEIAEAVRESITEDEIFDDLLAGMLDGLAKGYGVVEIMWDTGGKVWKPKAFLERDPKWFVFDRETGRKLRLIDVTNPTDGIALDPSKYGVHIPKLKAGLPVRGGLARLAAWSFLFKNYSVKDWAAFSETYGQPLRLGKYDKSATPEDVDTLYQAVAMIGTDCAAVVPAAMQIEFVNGQGVAGSGADIYEKFARFLDSQVSKAVLGQTMTADDGASKSQAMVHDGVRGDLRDADAKSLARSIRGQVIAPFVGFNWGPSARLPKLSFVADEAVDLTARSTALSVFVDRGLRVKASQIRAEFDLDEPDDDDEVLVPLRSGTPPQAASLTAPPEGKQVTTPAAAAKATNSFDPAAWAAMAKATHRATPVSQDAIDLLQAKLDSGWEEVLEPMVSPVVQLAVTAGSFEAFQVGLEAALRDADPGELARALGPMLFKARGLGDASDDVSAPFKQAAGNDVQL